MSALTSSRLNDFSDIVTYVMCCDDNSIFFGGSGAFFFGGGGELLPLKHPR